jgi:hypothetical protein
MLSSLRTTDKCLSASAHVLIVATMVFFIMFIERTILVAGISGVNTIKTTGQLIPFVTGVFSLIMALKELMMLLLWEVSGRNALELHPRPADEALLGISRLEQMAHQV